jgi:hypothetical protein
MFTAHHYVSTDLIVLIAKIIVGLIFLPFVAVGKLLSVLGGCSCGECDECRDFDDLMMLD